MQINSQVARGVGLLARLVSSSSHRNKSENSFHSCTALCMPLNVTETFATICNNSKLASETEKFKYIS